MVGEEVGERVRCSGVRCQVEDRDGLACEGIILADCTIALGLVCAAEIVRGQFGGLDLFVGVPSINSGQARQCRFAYHPEHPSFKSLPIQCNWELSNV
jgi:hypothetical protein